MAKSPTLKTAASDPSPASAPAAGPEKINVTIRESERMLMVFGSINDGFDKNVDEKDGEKFSVKTVKEFYPFSPKLRVLIAKHMNELEKIMLAWKTDRDALLKKISKGTGTIDPKADPALASEFFEQDQAERDRPRSYEAVKIAIDELPLEEFPSLNANVIAVLTPILTF